ncbi:hypothetical protein BGZ61DRAFT_438321 [Ilyonectria robusta]|uniref:uncharacterized protein n=1 Tax=Ilyonectria robusta TaxID=1079257 RepID=UPI001E8E32F2|nr:uncharacterized protein BGZ61DRAFT_438321 [Ilyonectria robusta]KAH8737440.1 hypothetical protein BGZ61DRAFT_438321 [Ilyonectria robusta]
MFFILVFFSFFFLHRLVRQPDLPAPQRPVASWRSVGAPLVARPTFRRRQMDCKLSRQDTRSKTKEKGPNEITKRGYPSCRIVHAFCPSDNPETASIRRCLRHAVASPVLY